MNMYIIVIEQAARACMRVRMRTFDINTSVFHIDQ